MKKLDIRDYKIKKRNSTAYRFQQLVLDSFDKYEVDQKGKGMVWGQIRKWKRSGLNNSQIEFKISRIATSVEELTPRRPDRYFVKLFFIL